jgi:hypothetical protein
MKIAVADNLAKNFRIECRGAQLVIRLHNKLLHSHTKLSQVSQQRCAIVAKLRINQFPIVSGSLLQGV